MVFKDISYEICEKVFLLMGKCRSAPLKLLHVLGLLVIFGWNVIKFPINFSQNFQHVRVSNKETEQNTYFFNIFNFILHSIFWAKLLCPLWILFYFPLWRNELEQQLVVVLKLFSESSFSWKPFLIINCWLIRSWWKSILQHEL